MDSSTDDARTFIAHDGSSIAQHLAHHLDIDALSLEDSKNALKNFASGLQIADQADDGHLSLVRHLCN